MGSQKFAQTPEVTSYEYLQWRQMYINHDVNCLLNFWLLKPAQFKIAALCETWLAHMQGAFTWIPNLVLTQQVKLRLQRPAAR